MIKLFHYKLFITIGFILLAMGVCGQQNFFNVPSFEITAKKKFFVQEQLNLNQIFQSNLTVDYGLGNNFQIGFNLLGVNFADTKIKFPFNQPTDKDIFEPLLLANAQKTFELSKYFNLSIGINQGINIDGATEITKYAQFDYVLAGSKFWDDNIVLVYGVYYGNDQYFLKSAALGMMAGADINLYKNKIHFVGDWISGSTPASVAVLGFSYFVTPSFPISFGWQIPNTAQNSSAVVLEFTWNPSLVVEKKEQ